MNPIQPLKNRLYKRLFRVIREHRKAQQAGLPRPRLEPEHLARCELLPTRQEMLDRLPKGSVGAELGVAQGEFTRDILDRVDPSLLHLVDVWKPSSARYGEEEMTKVLAAFHSRIQEGTVRVHRGRSTDVGAEIEDGSLDWVYIDTDHSYETTLAELRLYSKKMGPEGILAGDDFAHLSKGSWARFGVVEAVYEFCVEADFEFLFLTMEIERNPSFAIRRRSASPAGHP